MGHLSLRQQINPGSLQKALRDIWNPSPQSRPWSARNLNETPRRTTHLIIYRHYTKFTFTKNLLTTPHIIYHPWTLSIVIRLYLLLLKIFSFQDTICHHPSCQNLFNPNVISYRSKTSYDVTENHSTVNIEAHRISSLHMFIHRHPSFSAKSGARVIRKSDRRQKPKQIGANALCGTLGARNTKSSDYKRSPIFRACYC